MKATTRRSCRKRRPLPEVRRASLKPRESKHQIRSYQALLTAIKEGLGPRRLLRDTRGSPQSLHRVRTLWFVQNEAPLMRWQLTLHQRPYQRTTATAEVGSLANRPRRSVTSYNEWSLDSCMARCLPPTRGKTSSSSVLACEIAASVRVGCRIVGLWLPALPKAKGHDRLYMLFS